MLDDPMLDPMGWVVRTLRGDGDVATLVGMDNASRVRVRGMEPVGAIEQGGGSYGGDARGPGDYQSFIVVAPLVEDINPRLPISRDQYSLACYAATYQAARALWGAAVKAIHYVGPTVQSSNGLGIYISVAEQGGVPDRDPDTQQPLIRGTIRLIATAQAVT